MLVTASLSRLRSCFFLVVQGLTLISAAEQQIFASAKRNASISATFLPYCADTLAKEKGRDSRLPFSSASGGPRRTWTDNEKQSSLPKPATVRRTWSPNPLDLRSDSGRLGPGATVEESTTPWPWQPLATHADVSVTGAPPSARSPKRSGSALGGLRLRSPPACSSNCLIFGLLGGRAGPDKARPARQLGTFGTRRSATFSWRSAGAVMPRSASSFCSDRKRSLDADWRKPGLPTYCRPK